ncbi:MAG: DUF6876 family protein [Bacteroidales bacterium]
MQLWTKQKNSKKKIKPQHIHSINENWYLYLSDGSQLLKNIAQISWLYDYITAFQFHPKIKPLKVQKWVLSRKGETTFLMCLRKDGKIVTQVQLNGERYKTNAVIWVQDRIAMTTKEFRKYEQ